MDTRTMVDDSTDSKLRMYSLKMDSRKRAAQVPPSKSVKLKTLEGATDTFSDQQASPPQVEVSNQCGSIMFANEKPDQRRKSNEA
jgi:hypothetical protein